MGSWCNNVSVKKIALCNSGNKELPLTGRDSCRFFLINGELSCSLNISLVLINHQAISALLLSNYS